MFPTSWLKKLITGIVFLCPLALSAQAPPMPYDKIWNQIDSLIFQKGLVATALQKINTVYARARKERNQIQQVRVLMYRMQLQQVEDSTLARLLSTEEEAKRAAEPIKSILYSIAAKGYSDYLIANRWRLYQRSSLAGVANNDPENWSIEDFHRAIDRLYMNSVRNEKILQQSSLSAFEPLLVRGNARRLRPTLYDLLAHRALDYFLSEDLDIYFSATDSNLFAAAPQFARHHFSFPDSAAPPARAFFLYQRLLLFHENNPHPAAWVAVDIERLQFARRFSELYSQDPRYLEALRQLAASKEGLPEADMAWYLIAEAHMERGRAFHPPTDTTGRFAFVEARKICERVMQHKDSSEGRSRSEQLFRTLTIRNLALQVERVEMPGKPFRLFVSYLNLSKLNLRVIPVQRNLDSEFNRNMNEDAFWRKVTLIRPLRTLQQSLPDPGDMQRHSTELKMDSLPPGSYIILGSADSSFSLDRNPLVLANLDVSNISCINNGPDYFVLHRETGQPLERTIIQLWYRYFDKTTKGIRFRMGEQMITDKEGYFSIPPSRTGGNQQFVIEYTRRDDHLMTGIELTYRSHYNPDEPHEPNENDSADSFERRQARTFLYTDRSVYRPGQTLFFKALAVTRDFQTGQPKPFVNRALMMYLRDANGRKVDSLPLLTNEWGSCEGQFRIPARLLSGEFSLGEDQTGASQAFSVEQYKRPGFQVTIGQPSGSLRLGDSVILKGHVRGYGGHNINDANIFYRVTRRPVFPRTMPLRINEEIAQGWTRADQEGNFLISFMAKPARGLGNNRDDRFEFSIQADATDPAGATVSTESRFLINGSRIRLTLGLSNNAIVTAGSLEQISVITENFAGVFTPALVKLKLQRLESPGRLIRPRIWPEPDEFVLSREDFIRYFPYDEYSHETRMDTWPRKEVVASSSDSTRLHQEIRLNNKNISPGWYLLETTAVDSLGEETSAERYVQVYDTSSSRLDLPAYLWSPQDRIVSQPGHQVNCILGSSLNDQFVITQTDRRVAEAGGSRLSRKIRYEFNRISNEKKNVHYSIVQNDLGGFGVYHVMVRHNRVFTDGLTVDVPWTDKQLGVELITHQKKAIPGKPAKWTIRILSPKQDAGQSEICTTLYDASLDQLREHRWQLPQVFPAYFPSNNWNGLDNFHSYISHVRFISEPEIPYFRLQFDRLLMDQRQFYFQFNTPRPMPISSFKRDISGPIQRGFDTVPLTTASEKRVVNAPDIRRNFQETAFFLPSLKPDSAGNADIDFTMPESITDWHWMAFAHDRQLAMGFSDLTISSQKDLMLIPNNPRFLRAGDKFSYSIMVVNQTDSELQGQVHLFLRDPVTGQSVDGWFQNLEANQFFTVPPRQQVPARFSLQVPHQFERPVIFQLTASASPAHSPSGTDPVEDAVETPLPVVTDKIFITESLPFEISKFGASHFRFERLLQSEESQTLQQHALTVEFTSNPAWYALFALPSLTLPRADCAEQVFSSMYAYSLAGFMRNSSAPLRSVLEQWKRDSTATNFLSPLERNPDLKSATAEATPWLSDALSASQQKNNLAIWMDSTRLQEQARLSLAALSDLQLPQGGFPWFKGGSQDRFMTQYILAGIGRLVHLGVFSAVKESTIQSLVGTSMSYLDRQIREDRNSSVSGFGPLQAQYLYTRSFFPSEQPDPDTRSAIDYFLKLARQSWIRQEIQIQAMIAISLFRQGDIQTAKQILASLRERALNDPKAGMSWPAKGPGAFWYEAAVETQAIAIEAFHEISDDRQSIDRMKTWLLRQKQTQRWKTSTATCQAVYAILLEGTKWTTLPGAAEITLGNQTISNKDVSVEPGTGYFRKVIAAPFLHPDMGNITVTRIGDSSAKQAAPPSWGAVYWQYFEDLDKITPAASGLSVRKNLFRIRDSAGRQILEKISDNQVLRPGARIMVRLEIRSDRNLEYVHLRDMRAAGTEPGITLSGYRWQGGLSFYQSTMDLSNDFFFSRLPQGNYIFEYPLFVSQIGDFSSGIATIQCMYAPQLVSHSREIRVNVEDPLP